MALLRESIQKVGLLQPIVVGDQNVIIDGYRRWRICRELGWTDVPVHVVEGDAEELRIIAQTRRHEFGRTEKKILVSRYLQRTPNATAGDIAHTYQWSVSEVEALVGVKFAAEEIQEAYDYGKIPLSTMWHVARLKPELQSALFEEAGHDVEQLHELAEERLRVVRGARRRQFTTRLRFRKVSEVLEEGDRTTVGGPLLIKHKAETPMDGWKLAIQWVLNNI